MATALTSGWASALDTSIDLIRAWAWGLRKDLAPEHTGKIEVCSVNGFAGYLVRAVVS